MVTPRVDTTYCCSHHIPLFTPRVHTTYCCSHHVPLFTPRVHTTCSCSRFKYLYEIFFNGEAFSVEKYSSNQIFCQISSENISTTIMAHTEWKLETNQIQEQIYGFSGFRCVLLPLGLFGQRHDPGRSELRGQKIQWRGQNIQLRGRTYNRGCRTLQLRGRTYN